MIDNNSLTAIIVGCLTLLGALFLSYFQDLIKASMFGKIRCGTCQGQGQIVTFTSSFPELRLHKGCDKCGSTGYLPFKIGGEK